MTDDTRTLTAVETTEGDAPVADTQERTDGEQAISETLGGGLRNILGMDFSDVEADPNKYQIRKMKGGDWQKLRKIVTGAITEMRSIQDKAAAVDAENEPARFQIREVIEQNTKRMERGDDLLPMPNVVLKPEPNTGLEIAQMAMDKVGGRLIFDEDSWLASMVEEEGSVNDLDFDWFICALEKLFERDDLPNSFARLLRMYQGVSNVLRTKQQ